MSYLRRKADANKRKYVRSNCLIISCRNRFEDRMKSPRVCSQCLGVPVFSRGEFLYSCLLSGGFSTHAIFVEFLHRGEVVLPIRSSLQAFIAG